MFPCSLVLRMTISGRFTSDLALTLTLKMAAGQKVFCCGDRNLSLTFLGFSLLVGLWLPVDEQSYWPLIYRDHFRRSPSRNVQMTTNLCRKDKEAPAANAGLHNGAFLSKEMHVICRICRTTAEHTYNKNFFFFKSTA